MAQSVWLFKGRVFDYFDAGLINYVTLNGIYNNFFVWSNLNYTGLVNQVGSVLGSLISVFDYMLISIFGMIIGTELYFGLLIFIGAISSFLLLYELTDAYKEPVRIFSGFFAVCIFSFYASPDNGPGYGMIGVFLPLSILLLYSLYKKIGTSGSNYKKAVLSKDWIVFLSIISVGGLFAFGGSAYDIQNAIIIIIIMSFLVALSAKNIRRRVLVNFVIVFLLSILINATLFGGVVIFTSKVGSEFFNSGSLGILQGLNRQSILNAMQVYISNRYYSGEEIAVLLLALTPVFSIFNNAKKKSSAIVLALFASLFVFGVIYANLAPPFGPIYSVLLGKFKELLVFRYSYSSFYYIMYFIFGSLSALGIAYTLDLIMSKFKRSLTRRVLAFGFAFLVLCLLIIRIYYIDYLPNSSNFGVVVPNNVYNVTNYINSAEGSFNVGIVPPEGPFYYFDRWYSGTNIYSYFINHPVFTGGYDEVEEMFFPPSINEYNSAAGLVSSSNYTNRYLLAKSFGILGVRYIILQRNAIGGGYGTIDFNSIYSNINKSYGITLLKTYGNTSIYYNNFYDPLVFAANVKPYVSEGSSELFLDTSNASFNISDYVSYNPNSTSFGGNIGRINNLIKPNITYVIENPTLVRVTVSNANTPFYLIFRETYDGSWEAYYNNGTEVNPSNHIEVNGFENAWYINKGGNYTLNFYYTPQTLIWGLWIISFMALLASACVSFYSRTLKAHLGRLFRALGN